MIPAVNLEVHSELYFLIYRLSTLLKISKTAGVMLKPHIAVLVTALLEAVSGLEPQVMNYLSVRVSQETQNRVQLPLFLE